MTAVVGGTALSAALTGGAFLAFSAFVMPALRRLPPWEATAAMQRVNEVAARSAFMVPLLGSAAGGVVVGVWALTAYDGPPGALLAGAALNAVSFGVTAMRNVPLNEELARLRPAAGESPPGRHRWDGYVGAWTRWNHIRALASTAGACCLVLPWT